MHAHNDIMQPTFTLVVEFIKWKKANTQYIIKRKYYVKFLQTAY